MVAFTVAVEVLDTLRARAAAEGRPLSHVAEEALRRGLATQPAPPQPATWDPLEPPADVAAALREALASLPAGVARIPDAVFLLDEVGIASYAAPNVEAAERVLREAGWREDSEGWGRAT